MIYLENNGKISKLTTDAPLTLTHSPVKLWDMAGWSVDGLESLVNGTPYQLLIDCLPLVGGDIVKIATIWDEKAQGTAGGTFTNGAWRQRDLNSKNDPDSIVSLASNTVTIAVAGKYFIRAICPAYAVTLHQARLLKNGSVVAIGTGQYTHPSYGAMTHSTVQYVGTLAVNDTLTIEHRCVTTVATYGLGTDGGQTWGVNVYSMMEVVQWT